MRPDTLPAITSQAALHEVWETLLAPHGYSRRTLWLMIVQDGRAIPPLAQLDDVPALPTSRDADSLVGILRHMLRPGQGVAFVISRPGRDGLTAGDRLWAQALYAACRDARIPCETVHRANDVDLRPLPLDEVPEALSAAAAPGPR